MFATLQTGFAADVPIDNTTTGGINGAITNSTTNPGDTILLNPGNYTGTSNTGITINKNVTIQGNGPTDQVIIDAEGQRRIFAIISTDLSVTFINITFINGNTVTGGGAVHSNSTNNTLRFINCTFTNNTASIGGGGIFILGGIDNMGILEVIDCIFNNNTANRDNGGGIRVGVNDVRVINCIFNNNSAVNAGGRLLISSPLTSGFSSVINCTFNNNNANYGAGLVFTSHLNFSVINCTFNNNRANVNGGGLEFHGALTNGTVINCVFNNNSAGNRGGAIFNSGNMSLSANIMSSNTASLGQMIFNNNNNNNGFMGILNLTFISNSTLITKIGSIVTLYASLTDDMGNTVTGQNISFYLNGVLYENVEVTEGLAEINFTPTLSGDIPVSGEYGGNGDFAILINNGLLRIIKINANTTIVVPEKVTVGKEVNITGVLTDEDGNPVGNVTLNVTVGNKTFTVVTNPDGSWSLPYTPDTVSNLDVTVSLTDNDTYNDFSNSTNLNVVKIDVSSTIVVPEKVTVGKEVNITGVATDEDGNPLANTVLTVTVDGKTYTVTTDSNGRWTHAYIPTHTGTIEASVSWAGNDTHNGFTNNANFNVAKRNIIVTINVTENPDGSVTVIANATYEDGSPAPGYPVDFLLDGKIIGTGVTDSNGIATLTIPANKISDGPHTISVVVIGDDTINDATASTEFTKTTKDNPTKKTNNKPAATAAMKNTGIPIIAIILVLLTSIGLIVVKRKN